MTVDPRLMGERTPRMGVSGASGFARRTARLLTTRYALAIAAVAAISLAGQVLVQVALSRQLHDGRVINLAGRQRNYSQALCKTVIATLNLDPAASAACWEEARDLLGRFDRVHRGLQTGDAELDLPRNTSPAVAARFTELEPAFAHLRARVDGAIAVERIAPPEVAPLLGAQREFLTAMERVVAQLDGEARARVAATRRLELGLFAVLTLVLTAEILFIFRPAVRRIRHEIETRELAEQAAIEREIAEVSGRLERRIGQDLHDGLGQVLTGISFQVKALERRLGDSTEAAAAAEITTQVTQAIVQTRSLARLLHPVEAEADSLAAAMHGLGATAERVFRIEATVAWAEDLPIPRLGTDAESHGDGPPDSQETPPSMHLYRITQEAVSNAIRHGSATRVWITGRVVDGRGMLTIEDDGRGFVPPTRQELHHLRSGMGLRIMGFRAERIGAQFTIERRAGGGMRITVDWPYAASGARTTGPLRPA